MTRKWIYPVLLTGLFILLLQLSLPADHQLIHALPHLACRLIGKGDCQNIPGRCALFYQISYPMRQHTGFSGTGSRQNQKRSFCMKHRFPLFRIQKIIAAHNSFVSLRISFLYQLLSAVGAEIRSVCLGSALGAEVRSCTA